MDIARDDQYLLVVTENGFGKRTLVADYRKTSRGAKGVKTIQQTEAKGALAAALVVRDHHQLVFISQNGMVQRIARARAAPAGPQRAGLPADERARRRRRVRRGAGRRVRGDGRGRRRRARLARRRAARPTSRRSRATA